jgi:hypothetical protein
MSSVIGAGVSLKNIYVEDFNFTFNLKTGIVAADVGKAVSLDTTAANTVKLAEAGELIIGRLETVEDRKSEGLLVGTVAMKGSFKLPLKSGATVVVGDVVVGSSTAGAVQAQDVAAANIALSTSNTYTDAAVNSAVNTAIAEFNSSFGKRSNLVVEVGADFVVAIIL